MTKIDIKTNLQTPDNDLEYFDHGEKIPETGIIKYRENDELETNVTFNYKKNSLERENNQLYMKYIFKEGIVTKGILKIKDLDKIIELIIKTKEIKVVENKIKITFLVENKEYIYTIEEI